MEFLQASRRHDLASTDTRALDRYFRDAFAGGLAAQQGQAPALSVEELQGCLAMLVSNEYTQGVDPKSGRAYYVHNQTRAPIWVIDTAAVDACLGRIFMHADI